jgi:hypothetical protein
MVWSVFGNKTAGVLNTGCFIDIAFEIIFYEVEYLQKC